MNYPVVEKSDESTLVGDTVKFQKIPIIDNILEGIDKTTQLVNKYPDFTQVIHYPNGNIKMLSFPVAIKQFLEEKEDNLQYFSSTELDVKNKEINIYIIPKVESA